MAQAWLEAVEVNLLGQEVASPCYADPHAYEGHRR